MSGHSKWATIKRKKGAADAKRGQVFTRITREIVMAVRESGSDTDSNFRLRLAIEKARGQNMPKENIERAIKRGTGEGKDAAAFEEIFYEGYGPHGVAMMIECVTENRNRTVAEVRHMLERFNGKLGALNSLLVGLGRPEAASAESALEELIRARDEARAKKDYKLSDEIRSGLKGIGILLEDKAAAGGVRWSPIARPPSPATGSAAQICTQPVWKASNW